MSTNDKKDMKNINANELIGLYKEVKDFMSFLHDEQKKNLEENQ